MLRRFRGWRRGLMVPIVVLVLAAVAIFVISVSFTTSSTARASARAADLKLVGEVGRFAIREVMEALERSLSPGAPLGPGGVDWRRTLLPPYASRAHPTARVPATLARGYFGERPYQVDVGTVTLSVSHWGWDWETSPPVPGTVLAAPAPLPQGVLEARVVTTARRGLYQVRRTVVERWVFFVAWRSQPSVAPASLWLTPLTADVVLASAPLGTQLIP